MKFNVKYWIWSRYHSLTLGSKGKLCVRVATWTPLIDDPMHHDVSSSLAMIVFVYISQCIRQCFSPWFLLNHQPCFHLKHLFFEIPPTIEIWVEAWRVVPHSKLINSAKQVWTPPYPHALYPRLCWCWDSGSSCKHVFNVCLRLPPPPWGHCDMHMMHCRCMKLVYCEWYGGSAWGESTRR